ncbi:hypothetical protein FOQG_03552 [Fusarium oxysporum f. sp. raphani 54005]|uniref:BTB domain-containing protein n=2 Tax=Fusarium oxysporum f. sp. raphani TaxID=96318 RepID=X0CZ16_FUSOX|nr:hypothetical protein FOQG_03552 [Fusarium oxysporum f. sp. raphani 54005]KAG7438338.1 hypothetical protein Forpi1262_v000323 [Fusarium oxysporum f. sp. raphani]
MAAFTHDIVPDGDLYIVLKEANTKRTIPSVSTCYYMFSPPQFKPDPSVVNLPETSSGLELQNVQGKILEYRFRVSSHHLTLSSPIFKAMLNSSWKESAPTGMAPTETTPIDKTPTDIGASPETPGDVPQTSSVREISTTGWDVHAFVTVLRIIHGCNRQVPQVVSLSFFIDVAVIVDYYGCADALIIVANLWKQPFLKPTKIIHRKESIMWLWIAWVFSWSSDFHFAAYREARNSEGLDHVDTHDLPIAMLLEKLEKKRKWSLEVFSDRLVFLRAELLARSFGCSDKCRCILLGAIDAAKYDMHKRLATSGPPYSGISIGHIDDIWDYIDLPDCREASEIKRGSPRCCSLQKLMSPTFDKIFDEFGKIKITDFQAKKV